MGRIFNDAPSIEGDPRTEAEQVTDWVDSRIIDFCQSAGLLELDDKATYDREELLILVRRAWLDGVSYAISNVLSELSDISNDLENQ